MKFRIGFVSNSSSASFVLHTKLTVVDFKWALLEFVPNLFDKKLIRREILSVIKRLEKYVKDPKNENKNKDKMIFFFAEQYKKEIICLKKQLRQLDKIECGIDVVDFVSKFNHEKIEKNNLGFACIRSWTSMWSDEDSSMGKRLIEIRDMLIKNFGKKSYMIEVNEDN